MHACKHMHSHPDGELKHWSMPEDHACPPPITPPAPPKVPTTLTLGNHHFLGAPYASPKITV